MVDYGGKYHDRGRSKIMNDVNNRNQDRHVVVYVIDTSSFSNLRYYPDEYVEFSKFWDIMKRDIADGVLIAPKEVGLELQRGDKQVLEWVNTQPRLFIETAEMYELLQEIITRFPTIAHKGFKNNRPYHADPHVIALARMFSNACIITEETPGKNKIPTIAENYGIESIKLIEYLHRRGVLTK